ncbi:MAG: hypothetical protein ACM3S0_09770 [Acidobacteriota bacterium]
MDAFTQAVTSWHDFYIMTGTAAASLLGLLFVGLSLNLEIISRQENIRLSGLATQTFGNFVYVIFLSITMLIPDQNSLGVGIPLLIMGFYGTLANGRALFRAVRKPNPAWGPGYVFWRFVGPVLASLGLLVVSFYAFQSNAGALYGLIAVIIILLLVATRNSWDLLVQARVQAQSK